MDVALDGDSRGAALVRRLYDAFATQVNAIEQRIARQGSAVIAEDAKLLSGLVRTLETLISLDRKVQGGEEIPDVTRIRAELAARLAKLEKDTTEPTKPRKRARKSTAGE